MSMNRNEGETCSVILIIMAVIFILFILFFVLASVDAGEMLVRSL